MPRVLVVDDSRETCELLEELLGDMGLDVKKATKPEEALRLLEGGHIDLMLSDINLEARDRKSTRLNSSHIQKSRMPSSA